MSYKIEPWANGCRILIVEDDQLMHLMAITLFQKLGFQVQMAWNGAEALSILETDPSVKILFTDIRMPGMPGTELVELALSLRPDLKVVFATGSGYQEPLDLKYPVVTKPYSVDELGSIFRPLIGA